MAEMDDYSGPYKPDFTFADLSKEALIRLLENYQRIFVGALGVVGTVLKGKLGDDEALKLWNEIYDRQVSTFEIPLVREAMNIQGNDVISMLKYFQTCTDGARKGTYEYDLQINGDNNVTLTFTYCQSAHYWERHNDMKGLQQLCAMGPGSAEHAAFTAICREFNPKMKMEWPLLPPRESEDAPYCRWRFWVEEKAS